MYLNLARFRAADSARFTHSHGPLTSRKWLSVMSIGLDLDLTGSGYSKILHWTRTVNLFKILEPDQIWTELIKRKCAIFVVKKLHFKKYIWLHLDLDFAFEKIFGLWLDLDWVFKNQDWIWIAKFDSPFISGGYRSEESDVFRIKCWLFHFDSTVAVV